jgi:bacterioferritin-associated ferredoxin
VYVCLCRAVTSKTIVKVIAKGASTVEQVGLRTGAGTRCGRCQETIELLLAEAGGNTDGGRQGDHRTAQ